MSSFVETFRAHIIVTLSALILSLKLKSVGLVLAPGHIEYGHSVDEILLEDQRQIPIELRPLIIVYYQVQHLKNEIQRKANKEEGELPYNSLLFLVTVTELVHFLQRPMQEDNDNDVAERETQIDQDFAVVSPIFVAFFGPGKMEEYVAADLKEHNN